MDATTAGRVAQVRAFNRFYTGVIGVLNDRHLHTRWNLSEARVIFELATRGGADGRTLRRDLGLDSGYLSRMLSGFEARGLIRRERSQQDRRRQLVTLTPAGRKEFTRLNRRAANDIERLLAAHSDKDQRRVLHAMETIRDVLEQREAQPQILLRPPNVGEYGWVIERHGAIYSAEYGWDRSFEALVTTIVADYLRDHDSTREAAWIAEMSGEPVGCIFCLRRDDVTAQLRLLLVEPRARGVGAGSALIDQCVMFARDAGYRELVLWTNDVLVDARRLYERAGFQLIDEEPHHSFGANLVGQNWSLDLLRL
jgi:DNA-binding MarR family transcriptional regulator/GNAT superfamily N-acetyltransferase